MRGLSDKTAIVVGGATMIGQSVAETLVGYGADVVIADINEANDAGARSHRPRRLSVETRHPGLQKPIISLTNFAADFSRSLHGANEKAKLASSFFIHLPNRKLAHPSRSIRALR